MTRGDLHMNVPTFVVDDVVIWGATAMVLAEFLALLGWTSRLARPICDFVQILHDFMDHTSAISRKFQTNVSVFSCRSCNALE